MISRGILSNGTLVTHYYTTEPSPGQWVAVGTVMFWPISHEAGFPRWMLVGTGRTEKLAVSSLRDRMHEASPPRWKIKCEPVLASESDEASDETRAESGGYVVPWEIGREQATRPRGLKVLEAAQA